MDFHTILAQMQAIVILPLVPEEAPVKQAGLTLPADVAGTYHRSFLLGLAGIGGFLPLLKAIGAHPLLSAVGHYVVGT